MILLTRSQRLLRLIRKLALATTGGLIFAAIALMPLLAL